MENLMVAYTHTETFDVWTTFFDGTRWTGNTPIKAQEGHLNVQSATPPGTAVFNNWIYIVYKPLDSNDLCCAWFNGSRWTGGIKIESMNGAISPKSDSSPSIAVFKGTLYMVYVSPGSNDVYYACFDGTTWFGNVKICEQSRFIAPQTKTNPGICVYDDRLFIFYIDSRSNVLHVAWFDGAQWYGDDPVLIQTEISWPIQGFMASGVGVFKGLLHLAYVNYGNPKYAICTCTFDGKKWTDHHSISLQPGGCNPKTLLATGLGILEDKLYLVYRDLNAVSADLFSCHFDGKTWGGEAPIGDQPGGILTSAYMYPRVGTIATTISHAKWMSELPDNILIGDINLPGSHDAAAINTVLTTPYACHNYSITRQLEYGIRVLDVRLKIMYRNGAFVFITCHGKIGSTVRANEYQTLQSLLDECRRFLSSNPTETILMLLKVDDWTTLPDNKKIQAMAPLELLLRTYPTVAHPHMPQLGAIRGEILLYNRISTDPDLGTLIDWNDNTAGSLAGPPHGRTYDVYVQDKYEDLGQTYSDARYEKLRLVKATFNTHRPGRAVLNFASGTTGPLNLLGVYIMEDLLAYFGRYEAIDRPSKFGWLMLDYGLDYYKTDIYSNLSMVTLIISSNFKYRGYEDKFCVVGKE
jgi:hypothetical protein